MAPKVATLLADHCKVGGASWDTRKGGTSACVPGEAIMSLQHMRSWLSGLFLKMSLVEERASTMSVNISVPDDERSLVEDQESTMSVNFSVPDDERSLVEDRASTMSVNISVPDDERSLVEDRASTMSVNISVPDDERSLVEDRASTISVNISVPDDERSLVEDRASIMSVNISVLMMSGDDTSVKLAQLSERRCDLHTPMRLRSMTYIACYTLCLSPVFL
ncbi:hypothetical protein DNTS_012011 [Danionella cerebrum]|uniref:Uncharacterized protein n=1 Tax=Danionella cerebrum TaxID=2873325 RepID=A0A553N3X3_9TELE|nr:hypothetical protein DNTS_012011 [Danionella translucida]